MIGKNKITLLYIILLFSPCCLSQPYISKHLGVQDGLSNNYVNDIEQDGQNCIWIGTESGLSRFDGKNFTNYNQYNSGLVNNAVNVLLYDKNENKLWVGTKDGLSRYCFKTNQFENYISRNGIKTGGVVHLAHAADTAIWIVTHHNGIVHYDKRSHTFTSLTDKNIQGLNKSNWYLYDDGNGTLYIGHSQSGMSIVDTKNNTLRNFRHDSNNPQSIPGNNVYCILIDRMENIWVGTNQGLALFNPRKDEFLVFRHEPGNANSLISDHIYDIREMKDGTLWICSDIGGISILDLHNISFMNPESVEFLNITADNNNNNSLSSNNIRTSMQDSFGNIWVGNYSSGVDFISHTKPPFRVLPYTMDKGKVLKNKPVWGIFADNKDQVWLGGENEVAVFKDNSLKRTIDISSYLNRPYGQVFTLKESSYGLFFLGIYDDGLLKYNSRQNKIERIELDMDNIDIITFFEDASGKMWIGTEYGIYSYVDNKLIIENEITSKLRDRSVYGILIDNQEKLWVGTYGGGISVFDKDGKIVEQINSESGFSSNSISHIYMDSKGAIWVATRNGIGYIEDTNYPQNYKLYNHENGLEDSHVRAIQEDQDGNIWVSTNDGISYWDKIKNKFDNYDHRDGIPIGNFIEGSSCITSDGTIYFGSLNGVCYFNPHELTNKHKVAPVQIMEVKSFNRKTENREEELLISYVNGKIDLPYNQNSFRVSFSVPDYSQNQQIEYSYMIYGLDNAWYNTQGENQVTFRNMPAGDYTFKVKARMKNQDWDESHIASLEIRIHPPIWLTWYAKLLYMIVIFSGIYLFIRSYKNRLKLKSSLELERKNSQNKQELNDDRLRFYTNITHELRTPLTLILGPLEDLIHDSNLSSYYNTKINTIHSSAIQLLNLINQILEFRKTETQNRKLTVLKGDLGSLVTEIGLRYKELNRNKKTNFYINIDTTDTILYYDADMVNTILNNLLSNAVKYTPEGDISITMRSISELNNKYTEIEVSDTGYGIDMESLPHIFDRYYQAKGKYQSSGTGIGLALVKSLAELHEGTLEVVSSLGKGTSFTFRILTENTYPNALHTEEKEVIQLKEPEKENTTGESIDQESIDEHPVILIIEDNTDIRQYISSSLAMGYNVITADNGKEGLEMALKDIPDIIVSDIMMPEMDGIELCRIIKDDIRTSHIPVILLTVKDSIQDKEEGYESGADSYLTKPFSAKLLRSRIQNLLDSRKKLAKQIAAQTVELKNKKDSSPIRMSILDEQFLNKLTNMVEENLDMEQLDIAFIIDKMNMSHSTFYRKVKGLTGLSPSEFIRKIKLMNSLKLLLTGNYNISEAAYMTGFNNLPYFRQCFKDEYGLSPSEYLRKSKND